MLYLGMWKCHYAILNIDVYKEHLWWPTFWCKLQFCIKIYYDLTLHWSIFLNIRIIMMIYSPWNFFCEKPLKPGSKFLQRRFSNLNFNWKSIWQLTVLRILKENCQVKTSNFPSVNCCVKELICTGEERSWKSTITWTYVWGEESAKPSDFPIPLLFFEEISQV